MRRLKRLAVCLCAVMMGVATVIMPVSAKDSGDFNDVRPSYTDSFVGEKVVVQGFESLQDGSLVNIAE